MSRWLTIDGRKWFTDDNAFSVEFDMVKVGLYAIA